VSRTLRKTLWTALSIAAAILCRFVIARDAERSRTEAAKNYCEGLFTDLRTAKLLNGRFPKVLIPEMMKREGYESFKAMRGEYSGHTNYFVFLLHLRLEPLDNNLTYNSGGGGWIYADEN
jgi:hypothetical protein